MKTTRIETKCVHGAYKAKAGEPQALPIAQSTTYRYYDNDDVAALFDLKSASHMYTRISNPTTEQLENKMALLEGGTGAVATSSGQSATLLTLLNICQAGDHILSSSNIYGGSHNLMGVSLKKLNITTTMVNPDLSFEDIMAKAKPNTKVLFAETLGNPALNVLDFEKFSKVAKALNIPFVVDNTLASPYLCRPLEHGADIVVHSTTKYANGNATAVGGMVIDGGTYPWTNGKYPEFTEPDESYHGIIFAKDFPSCPFATKLRTQLLRDFGTTMSPMNAFLTHTGLETLHLRMERHSSNALALASFLENNENVAWVRYPGLKSNNYYDLAQKYMPLGQSGVIVFGVKGGLAAGKKFIENLDITSLVVHVGDIRTSVLHPSSTTHRQLSEEQQIQAGIQPELIRVSVGIENIDDIIADFNKALIASKEK